MAKKILLLLLIVFFYKAATAQVAFTPGNLVVLRLGDGTTALSSAAAPVSLLEYTPTGTLVQTIVLNSATAGARVTNSGSAASEGALALSADGRYLTLVGYDAAAATAGVVAANPVKLIVRVDANGNIDYSTKVPAADISANNIRSAVTADGNGFWIGAANSVRYVPYGNSSTATTTALNASNTRVTNIFGRQLYVSAGSGTFQSVSSVGTGLPMTSGNALTQANGLPTGSGGTSYAFLFFDVNDAVAGPDLLYVADQSTASLKKYSFDGNIWTARGTVNASSSGLTGLTGAINAAGNVVLYATVGTAANNSIQSLTDAAGYTSNVTATFANLSTTVTAGANYAFRGLAATPAAFTWTGTTSTDWNVASNWSSAGIPNASASPISIPAGLSNYPDITANTYVANLSLEAGATIKVTGAGIVLRNASQPMTLKSDNAATARIGTSTGTIKGNVTVERYIPARRAFRFLTPGVTSTSTVKINWQEGAASSTANPFPGYGTHITGNTVDQTNGFDATTTGNPSMFAYTGSAWTAGIANTTATTFNAGDAYRILIRGNRATDITVNAATPSITRLRTTGSLYFGDYTPTISGAVNDYTLVGNPYVSPIDWHTVTKNNVSSTYYAWDPNMTGANNRGAYVSYDITTGFNNLGNTGTSAVNRYIQPGQAVFVQTSGASPSLTIKETDKQSTFTNVFRTNNTATSLTVLLFRATELASGSPADGATVVFDNQFNQSIGSGDVRKMLNPDENITILNSNQQLAIDARNNVVSTDTVWLNLSQLNNANGYALRTNAQALGNGVAAYMVDNFTGSTVALSSTANTDISFSITTDPASFASNRFYIVLRSAAALPVTVTNLKAYQYSTGVVVEWNTVNELNMNRYEVEKSNDGIAFSKVATVAAKGPSTYNWLDASPLDGNNFYRLNMIDKNGTAAYTQTVNVKIGGAKNAFTVVGNPVKGRTVLLQLENVDKGAYTITAFNAVGQQAATKMLSHAGGSATQTIALGNIAAGTYQLVIVGSNSKTTKTIIVE